MATTPPELLRLRGARVLVTGHTGFKGSWLSMWLARLGCEVHGVSDGIPTEPALFEAAGVAQRCASDHRVDIADVDAVRRVVEAIAPDVVFHLAAQALVRASYDDPLGTWRTNVLGTAALLEAVRATPSVRATLVVTTDKVYEDDGRRDGYREHDRLGGRDPYAASKVAAELLVTSFRATDPRLRVATARAGNVIAGGDFAPDRLVPDLVRSARAGVPAVLRHPDAVRPWQDVRDCLHAYVWLVARLLDDPSVGRGWNVGPDPSGLQTVGDVAAAVAAHLPGLEIRPGDPDPRRAEVAVLTLDSTALRDALGWRPLVDLGTSLEDLVEVYTTIADGGDVAGCCARQLARFESWAGWRAP